MSYFTNSSHKMSHETTPGGGGWGYSNYFSTGCAARGLKPLPIRIFCPLKTAD